MRTFCAFGLKYLSMIIIIWLNIKLQLSPLFSLFSTERRELDLKVQLVRTLSVPSAFGFALQTVCVVIAYTEPFK